MDTALFAPLNGFKSFIGSIFTTQNIGADDMNKNVTDVICICGEPMELVDGTCYNETQYLYAICDECDTKCDAESKIYHCPKFQNDTHPHGYDICNDCAIKTAVQDIPEKSNELIVDVGPMEMETPGYKPIIKRALIIQTLSDNGNYECVDGVTLENTFTLLGYDEVWCLTLSKNSDSR